jgi:3-deoxy-7-phosphoheptulonate synthase
MDLKHIPLAARKGNEKTVIKVGKATVGKGLTIIAGPCSVESEEQIMETAKAVKEAGADMLRGGAFKPRKSPYVFQGLGIEGLKLLAKAKEETGLPIVTEVVDTRDVKTVCEYADVLQIGARNMQNYALLKEVGKTKTPVLLKRGLSATYDEWLNAAEYILSGGNRNVMLCERGIRTFESYTRNTLDLNAVPAMKELTHLPIIVDPSHGTGRAEMVEPMAMAAVACGADGLIVEVHSNPANALSDKEQALNPSQFKQLVKRARALRKAVDGLK